jgi:hypothetical protein
LTSIMKNYDAYMSLDLSSFEGMWIAIFNGNVIAHGPSPKDVYSKAIQISKNKRIMLTKIPRKGVIEML